MTLPFNLQQKPLRLSKSCRTSPSPNFTTRQVPNPAFSEDRHTTSERKKYRLSRALNITKIQTPQIQNIITNSKHQHVIKFVQIKRTTLAHPTISKTFWSPNVACVRIPSISNTFRVRMPPFRVGSEFLRIVYSSNCVEMELSAMLRLSCKKPMPERKA